MGLAILLILYIDVVLSLSIDTIIELTLEAKVPTKRRENTMGFSRGNAFENVFYKMAAILFKFLWINTAIPIMYWAHKAVPEEPRQR